MPTQTSKSVALALGFRSGLEKSVADRLQADGIGFKFEQAKLKYDVPARVSSYTPDFILRRDGGPVDLAKYGSSWFADTDFLDEHFIVETKGRFVTKDRQKHILIKEQRPFLDIRFVFSNPNGRISKQSATTYKAWCDKHGFMYAAKFIPKEWFTP